MDIITTETESQVTSVTIYQGRAMVTRTASPELKSGNHLIVFAGIPAGLDPESIQVKGTGEATLGECVFDTEYFVEDVDARRLPLLKKQQDLEDSLTEIQLHLDALQNEKELINKISNYITSPPTIIAGTGAIPASVPAELDADKWIKMLAFYTGQLADIDRRSMEAAKKSRKVQQEIDKVNSELNALGSGGQRSRNIIKVGITKKESGTLTLHLSYVIHGPSWRPVYNLRAASDSDSLAIEYDALVNQATGEDWQDVELKLSTARVNVSGIVPELYPWRLNLYRPAPPRLRKSRSIGMDDESDMFAGAEMAKSATCAPAEETYDEYEESAMLYDEADVQAGGTSVIFSVTGGGSISGNNTDTRVTIMRKELPAEFTYSAVPKLSEFAYLTSMVTNGTDFPLLPGRLNIFFDGSFVATSALDLIMPGQELETSLGVDEGVQMEYRFIKRFKKNEGLVNIRTSEQFDYQIRATNNRKKKISLKVYDQFPIPEEKDITVKTLLPVIKEGQKDISLDDESKIEWKFELAPGEKKELPLSFLVEYPVGSTISGL